MSLTLSAADVFALPKLIILALFASLMFIAPSLAQTYPPQIAAVDPTTKIHITDQASADAMRANLNVQIFGVADPYTCVCPCACMTTTYFSTFNPAGSIWAGTPNLATIQEWRATISKGVLSRFYRFTPTTYRNPTTGRAAFIVAAGHGQIGTYPPFQVLIKSLVAAGFEVITIDMPISGLNAAPTVSGPSGPVTLTSHDQMPLVKSADYNPLRMFLEPVTAVVNELRGRGITHIGMAGLSGGGWTTDLYAAIDPRIDASYSIAGSMPDYARPYTPPHDSTGDWEQREVGAGLHVDYMDLYILASIGTNRRHVNLHNVNDDCCFGGYIANHYAPAVHAVVNAIGTGSYDVAFDTTATTHTVSAWTAAWVVADVTSRM